MKLRRDKREEADPLKPIRRVTAELARTFLDFGDVLDAAALSIDEALSRLWELHEDAGCADSGEESGNERDEPGRR